MTATAVTTSADHARITTRAAMMSLTVAAILILLKGWAWLEGNSVAMLASLADSVLDLAASLFTFFAVRFAATPPDREHRFGHGKAEAFAGLVQAGLVAVSAALIAFEAGRRLFFPVTTSHGFESILVMLVSMGVTTMLVAYQTQALARTKSVATRADRLHYLSDVASNVVVICGIAAGTYFALPYGDAIAGLIVAIWLAQGAVKVAREAGDHLLDRELPETDRARIRALAEADRRITRVHDLRTRTSGPYIHVQFHADLDPTLTLEAAHKIVVAAETRIRASFPTADIIIHPDPKGRAEPHGHEHFEPAQAKRG